LRRLLAGEARRRDGAWPLAVSAALGGTGKSRDESQDRRRSQRHARDKTCGAQRTWFPRNHRSLLVR